MGKGNKNKKEKVPKITEEEYAAYLTALKVEEEKGKDNVLPNGSDEQDKLK